jgi:hypothetical protein
VHPLDRAATFIGNTILHLQDSRNSCIKYETIEGEGRILAEILAAEDLNLSGLKHQIYSTTAVVTEILDGQKARQ